MWCYIKCFAEVHKDETWCIFFVKKISYPITESDQASVACDSIGLKRSVLLYFSFLTSFENYLIEVLHTVLPPNII